MSDRPEDFIAATEAREVGTTVPGRETTLETVNGLRAVVDVMHREGWIYTLFLVDEDVSIGLTFADDEASTDLAFQVMDTIGRARHPDPASGDSGASQGHGRDRAGALDYWTLNLDRMVEHAPIDGEHPIEYLGVVNTSSPPTR